MASIAKHTHIAYRCPECGMMTVGLVGKFALAANMIRLKCECGGSLLTVQLTNDKKLRLSVPCVFCKDEHNFTVSQSIFFEKDLFLLNCPYAAMDIGFIGSKERIDKATEENARALEKLISDMGAEALDEIQPKEMDESEVLPDASVYDTIRLLIKDMEGEGTVDCPCHSGCYDLRYAPGGIQVFCPECGATHFFNCESQASCEEYLSIKELKLT